MVAITIDDVQAAAARLQGVAVRTPIISVPAIDELVGARVWLKAENLQRTGAFKFRGGYNAVSGLSAEERAAGVVAFSSGNHAQAVAAAATMSESTSVIVMPTDAPAEKIAATEGYGARVVLYDRYTEDRSEIAGGIAVDEGRAMIPPYDHPMVMAGQGTVALELVEQIADVGESGLDAMFVCLGGGGLLAGSATALASVSPTTQVFGVEPEAGDDHVRSRAAGERVDIGVPRTIADGQQVSKPGELTWPINSRLATDFLTVTDNEIVATMKLLFEHAKLVVEPSGASALAAVLHRDVNARGLTDKTIGVTLSGGNVGLDRFHQLLSVYPQ